jgi:hypothetical protein
MEAPDSAPRGSVRTPYDAEEDEDEEVDLL